MVQNNNNTREKKQHNSYSEVVFNRVINVLNELSKTIEHCQYVGKSDSTYYMFFGPAFESITDILHKYNEIPKSYKVDNLWFDDGELGATPYFILTAYNSDYDSVEAYSCNTWKKEVKEMCANEIANVLEQTIFEIRKETIESQNLPKVEEMDEVFLSYFNKYINNKEYKVSIENNEDVEEIRGNHRSFVIRHKDTNNYKCHFMFYNDKMHHVDSICDDPYYGVYVCSVRQSDIEKRIEYFMKKFHVA